MRLIIVGLLTIVALGLAHQSSDKEKATYTPPNGYVPDAATAVRIAEAILVPIYGHAAIESQKPLRASLRGGIWTVSGTLQEGYAGGVAVLKLRQKDVCVLYLMHGK